MSAENSDKPKPGGEAPAALPDAAPSDEAEGRAPAEPAAGEVPGPAPVPAAGKAEAKPRGAARPKVRRREHESRELAKIHRELADLKSAFDRLERDRDAHRVEAAGHRDKYLRGLAEMENLRKRLEREKNEYYLYALTGFLKQLVAVVDNFDRALKARDQADGKALAEGVELIHKQVLDLLRKQGVSAIEAAGRPFDPTLHQAIQTEEAEGVEEPVVGEELQRGYKIGDRLLRPSLVKVLVPKKP